MAPDRTSRIKFFSVFHRFVASFSVVAFFTTLIAGNFSFAQGLPTNRSNLTADNPKQKTSRNFSDSELLLPVTIYESDGKYPGSVVVADLNGDGKQDVVVANTGSGSTGSGNVAVFLGDGNGKLGTPGAYHISVTGPDTVAIADLNGDGKPDIVVAGYAYRTCAIAVLLGKGNGTFQPPKYFFCTSDSTTDAYSVAVADLNGDGKLDLALSTYRQVAILLGNGDGTFQPPATYSWGSGDGTGWGDRSLAVADVNGDGKPDIVVATGSYAYYSPGLVAVLLGNGDGTFQSAVDYETGTPDAYSLALGDVNGDGKLDIVVTNHADYDGAIASTAVLLGNGDGTFQAPTIYNTAQNRNEIALVDVNGDGIIDIVASDLCDDLPKCSFSDVEVLIGNGDGTFQLPLLFSSGGDYSLGLAIGDLNNDGSPDIVVTDEDCYVDCGHGWIGVLLNATASQAPTSTALLSSVNPSVYRQAVTFTATVTSSNGPPPNGETITFYNGSTVIGTAALSGGAAAITTSTLPAGIFTIAASYSGDSNFAASTSPGLRQVVNATTKSATSTTLASSLNPSIYGQKVIFTAVVTTTGPQPPTGNVVFTWSIYTIGSATLNSSGVATLTKSNLNADPFPLTAVYKGDVNNLGSTSPVLNQIVLQTTSAATISSSLNPASVGQPVTFIAKITSPTVMPTGPVTFKAGTTVLGTVQLSGGKASYTTTSLPAGSTPVKVTFNGNSNIKASSASITQVVQP